MSTIGGFGVMEPCFFSIARFCSQIIRTVTSKTRPQITIKKQGFLWCCFRLAFPELSDAGILLPLPLIMDRAVDPCGIDASCAHCCPASFVGTWAMTGSAMTVPISLDA